MTDKQYESLTGSPRGPGICDKCQAAIVEFFIFFAWVGMEVTNLILHLFYGIAGLWKSVMDMLTCSCTDNEPKQVVIVGASFGGLAALRELSGIRGLKVTLVDFKDFFEYTPGALRCLVQPSWLNELTKPLPSSRNALVTAEMTGVDHKAVTLKGSDGKETKLAFDYLVLAIGSTYAAPIKPIMAENTLAVREATLQAAHAKLAAASKVIIVGAGAVGMELVGEILTVYPTKQVIVVDFAKTILPGFDEGACKYALEWCEKAGVEFMFGKEIDKIEETRIVLKSGQIIEADVVYKCVGVMPNTAVLKGTPFEGKGFRGSVEVNDFLQIDGCSNVYCIGDMMSHSSRELKLGHTAEVNGHLVAHNIEAAVHGKSLAKYPMGVTGAEWTPKIYCLSLGKYSAVLAFNGLVLSGWYVAVIKWMLEWTKVAAAVERPIGVFFWWFADNFSNLLSRTILPPPGKVGQDPRGPSRLWCNNCFLDFLMANWLDFDVLADFGMLVMRVVSASLIVHHGLVKIENPHGFADNVIAAYFPFLPFDPLFWTYLSAFFELAGSFCITVGLFARPAAALLAGTLMVATLFQLLSSGLQGFPFGQPPSGPAYTFEPALAFMAVTGHITLSGPGRFALQPLFPSQEFLDKHTHPIFLLFKEPLFSLFSDLGMLVLRVVSSALVVHHGLSKVENPHGFADNVIAAYFPFLPFDPLFWTYLSASFEILGTFCVVIGVFVRPAAGLLMGTVMVATLFQLMSKGFQNYPFGQPPSGPTYTFEPALAFFGIYMRILFAGPGRFGLQTCCQPVRAVKVAPSAATLI